MPASPQSSPPPLISLEDALATQQQPGSQQPMEMPVAGALRMLCEVGASGPHWGPFTVRVEEVLTRAPDAQRSRSPNASGEVGRISSSTLPPLSPLPFGIRQL